MRALLRRLRLLVAKSWLLSRGYYRCRGMQLVGPAAEHVWYFAYGANMHDSAFRERRRMRPLEWRPGRIKGYRLRFNLEGRPRGKAAPANIEAGAQAEVWGVLYRITRCDLVWLDATEGVPGRRYWQIWTDAEDIDGNRITAVTYMAKGNAVDGQPSLRYLTLLRDGARAHRIPEHWIHFLETVKHAE